jgi:hypothetical protein
MRPTGLADGASKFIGKRGTLEFYEVLLVKDSVRGLAVL